MKILLEKTRPRIFWTIDFLKGSKIKAHLNDINSILENLNSPAVLQQLEERKKRIIDHAVTTTLFYKEYSGFKSINDLPIIDKNIIRDRFNEFLSTKYPVKLLKPVHTSGSTGTPFSILWDENKKIRNIADLIYFGKLAGFEFGKRLYYIRAWNNINRKTKLTLWIQNMVPINVFNISSLEEVSLLFRKIEKDKSSISLLGYASTFETICQYLDKMNSKPINAKIKGIISGAEALNEYTKSSMENYFKAPVVSRYSNQENGIIAQQRTDGDEEFYINHASYYIELLNLGDNNPAPLDTTGRIVVTDYYNFGMPIIRYDTGDIGIMSSKQKGELTINVLAKVEGRKRDMVYNTVGRIVSPAIIGSNMWKYHDIKQYQFIQSGEKTYQLILNCDKLFLREKKLIEELKEYFGKDALIHVNYVNEIPLLDSGKRKTVVNKYYQSIE